MTFGSLIKLQGVLSLVLLFKDNKMLIKISLWENKIAAIYYTNADLESKVSTPEIAC